MDCMEIIKTINTAGKERLRESIVERVDLYRDARVAEYAIGFNIAQQTIAYITGAAKATYDLMTKR